MQPVTSARRPERCPACGHDGITLVRKTGSEEAVLGVPELIIECHRCHADWVRAQDGSQWQFIRVTCCHCYQRIDESDLGWRHQQSLARFCNPAAPSTTAEPWARR